MGVHFAQEHLVHNKWVRMAAGTLAFVMLLTAVMASMARVTIDLSDFDGDPDSAAGAHLLATNEYAAKNWLQRAGIAAEAAITQPQSADDFYRLAEISISRADYTAARTYIETCLTLTDTADLARQAELWLVKGCLDTLLGEDDPALASLTEAARLNPTLDNAYLVQAQIYIEHQRWLKAEQSLATYFDRAEVINTRMYAAMGDLQMMLGDIQAAADQFTLSINDHNAADPDIYLRRAGCYAQLGIYVAAVADFTKAANLGADAVLCTENIVMCYLVLEDYKAVLEAGTKLASVPKAPAQLLQNMGVAALALERMTEAEAYFNRAIEANDKLVSGYYYRGICRLSLEQYEKACGDFTKSINRGEALQLSYYNRGVCYLNTKQYKEAQADFEWTVQTGTDPLLTKSARTLLQLMKNP